MGGRGDFAFARAVRFSIEEGIRVLGWRVAWIGALWSLRQRYLVLARDLDDTLPPAPACPDLRWSLLVEGDVARLTAIDPGLHPSEIARRLGEGQKCHLVWAGESIVHYRWETTRAAYLPFLGLTMQLAPGDVCGTWSYTAPAYRGRGLLGITSPVWLHRSRANGARRSLALVAWWNRASLRVTRDHAGRRVVGSVGFTRLGPWRRYFARGAVRFDGPRSFRVARGSE